MSSQSDGEMGTEGAQNRSTFQDASKSTLRAVLLLLHIPAFFGKAKLTQ